ncbi:MAG: hypothetical protein B7Z66_04910 [Chromatiales bacterium 21-64-14]|nr:MAG: hypothetical protein B7Z66_04910 [Chromatiales bacterium 21-64-14]HQU14669.1 pirin family protein [Gammaproteobacteria bacterium]
MPTRTITQQVHAMPVTEGAGVVVHRTLGTPVLRNLDPFLMLDHIASENPDDYIAGFPDHPHRGFVTVTYMLEGHMEHRDSMGNHGDLRAGGVQWMKAASGVIHSEMPQQSAGVMRGFQLWVNLPAREKMSDPAYQEFAARAIPVIEAPGARIRLLSGTHDDQRGPVDDPHTDVCYLHVTLEPNATFAAPLAADRNAFVYGFEGEAVVAGTPIPRHTLAVLGPGDRVEVRSGGGGAGFLLVAGRPLGEPIVQYGPFVMNTRAEIEEAMADFHAGRLVRRKAAWAGQ